MDFSFAPDPARARELDRAMHNGLADSLLYLSDVTTGEVPHDTLAITKLAQQLRQERFSPKLFGRYYELIAAIENGERELSAQLFAAIAAEIPVSPESPIVARIEDPPIAPDQEIYRRGMDTDPRARFDFVQPTAELSASFTRRLERAIARFEPVLPELFGEVRAIVSQIILATHNPDGDRTFDGGSSYQLWGALFLNPAFHPSELDVAEVIAHESAHSLLFGFTTDEPLVTNLDTELYQSPLRRDPRPMDGIYHATFVSARMHWAMSRLARSGVLTPEEQRHAEQSAARDGQRFAAGHSVVAEHARLTGTGRELMAAAHGYMAEAA